MSALSLPKRLRTAIAAMRSRDGDKEGKGSQTRPICGALGKRSRKPCQQAILYPNGRCHFHGGPSTGPKTEAGRQLSREKIMQVNEQRRMLRSMGQVRTEDKVTGNINDGGVPTAMRSGESISKVEENRNDLAADLSVGPETPQAMSAYAWYQMHSRDRRPRFAKT